MHNEIMIELSKACKRNPDLSIIEVLGHVLNRYMPNTMIRSAYNGYADKEFYYDRRTNSEILRCLKLHNNTQVKERNETSIKHP